MSGITTCKTCCDPIRWGITRDGQHIPLDADPIVGGNIQFDGHNAVVLDDDAQRSHAARQHPMFVSHFVTCPQADKWRRAR